MPGEPGMDAVLALGMAVEANTEIQWIHTIADMVTHNLVIARVIE